MTPAQLLTLVAALAGALLLSELVLETVRLGRARIGGLTWFAGCAATAWGTQWAGANTSFTAEQIHYAALAVAAVLTALWFNDRRPVTTRPARPRPLTPRRDTAHSDSGDHAHSPDGSRTTAAAAQPGPETRGGS